MQFKSHLLTKPENVSIFHAYWFYTSCHFKEGEGEGRGGGGEGEGRGGGGEGRGGGGEGEGRGRGGGGEGRGRWVKCCVVY